MAEKTEVPEESRELVLDPKKLLEGTCSIKKWGDRKVSVCKENGKIKIFEIVEEESK